MPYHVFTEVIMKRDPHALRVLCEKYEAGTVTRQSFWAEAQALGYNRAEIAAMRKFVLEGL